MNTGIYKGCWAAGCLFASVFSAFAIPTNGIVLVRQGYESTTNDTWSYTNQAGLGSIFTTISRKFAGARSLVLNGSNNQNADPKSYLASIALTGLTNVRLSVAFSTLGADSDDDLYVDLSYDNGASWPGSQSTKLVDGFNNADIPFGAVTSGNPTTVASNPFELLVNPAATQVNVRVRFDEKPASNASLDYYFLDEIILFYIPPGQPPEIAPLPLQSALVSQQLDRVIHASDIDSEPLELGAVELPPGASFLTTTGTLSTSSLFSFIPPVELDGTIVTARFYATDGFFSITQSMAIAVRDRVVTFRSPGAVLEEAAVTTSVPLTISRAVDATVHVAYVTSAKDGADFSSETTAVFSADGSTNADIPVVIYPDSFADGLERLACTIASTDGAVAESGAIHRILIRDDDSVSIASANLSDVGFTYHDPGARLLAALQPDIVGIQEWNVTNAGGHRAFVDDVFGTNYSYFVEDETLPNGVISRWPIVATGIWDDVHTTGRDFVWATIDLPGSRDLHIVCLHLKASDNSIANDEAIDVVSYVASAGFLTNDFFVICGDLNADARNSPQVVTLTGITSDARKPEDHDGDTDSNSSRIRPYDFVLPNDVLERHHLPVFLEGETFGEGLVFDSRTWTNTPPPAPAKVIDSGTAFMAHMAIMKNFAIDEPLLIATTVSGNGNLKPRNPGVSAGDTITFTATPNPYYEVVSLLTNGSSVAGATGSAPYVLAWNNVTSGGTLAVSFAEQLSASNTPTWWLAQNGVFTNFDSAATNDLDGDGFDGWEEYVTGTHPTNKLSRLAITNAVMSGGDRKIQWPSVANHRYTLSYSTNLANGFTPLITNLLATPPQNTLFISGLPDPIFFRVEGGM